MEIQLRELIDQIKKEGVEAAEAQAESIRNAAKVEAEKIVADAQAQADEMLVNAKNEKDRLVKAGEEAIRQAGRNVLLSFRDSVERELSGILNQHVTAGYSSEKFAQLLLNIVEVLAGRPDAEDITVALNSDQLKSLEDMLLAAMKAKMQSGVTLKANDNFDGGFRIAVNNGSAYYDYSTEAVVDMLSNYLSPKIVELLKEA